MSTRKHLKAGFVIASGSAVNAIGSFVRNLLIARIVSVEDFGIASAIAMTMSIVELTSDLGIESLLIQSNDGDDPKLQACAQAFQVIRGAFSSTTLFLVAPIVASLFRIPQAEWGLRWAALAPFIRSLSHLDFARLQRHMSFAPAAWVESIPVLTTTVLSLPLALWLGDYRVMLCVVLLQAGLQAIVSHVVAKRAYRLAYDRDLIRKMIHFGWPLMFNGLLMFGSLYGDRAIIGISFTVRELGWYSVAVSVLSVPALLVVRVLRSGLLPILSRHQNDPNAFQFRLQLCSEMVLCAATAFCLLWLVGGASLVILAFGQKYSEAVSLIPVLAILTAIRLLRVGPNVSAMALGETKNSLVANVIRLVSLPSGFAAAFFGYGVHGVVVAILCGEALAYVAALWIFNRWCKRPFPTPAKAFATCAACIAIGYVLPAKYLPETSPFADIGLAVAASAVGTIAVALTSPFASHWLRSKIASRNIYLAKWLWPSH